MEKKTEIVAALKMCAISGDAVCTICPYRDKAGDGMTCRQRLCVDAKEALAEAVQKNQAQAEEINDLADQRAELYNEVNELREALLMSKEKKTSVCFEVEEFKNGVKKLSEAAATFKSEANYWTGQADALKWFIEFYLATPTPESDDAVEVPDDV